MRGMYGNEPTLFEFRGLFGIRVEVRQSLVLLAGLFLLMSAASPARLLDTAILVAMIVLSIYLHELGHAWGCRVQGVPVMRIVIFGGGGFCEHRRAAPRQDELIVVMGPIVNLVLWAVSSLWVNWIVNGLSPEAEISALMGESLYWADRFATLNLALFFFNMLPVHPLDGGKLFFLGLLRLTSPLNALKVAGAVGVVFSILWWPALFWVYLNYGWLLLFAPSLRQHLAMMRGDITG